MPRRRPCGSPRPSSTPSSVPSARRRAEVAARLDAAALQRYEQLRARHGGVAISRLEGNRCGGCHLDLSTAEINELRALGASEVAECPNCGRLLVP